MGNRRKKNNFKNRPIETKTKHKVVSISEKRAELEKWLNEDIKRIRQIEELKETYTTMAPRDWEEKAAKMIRKGERLKAVKLIKEEEACSLSKAKSATDYYVEYGKWEKGIFSYKNKLERAFQKIMGISLDDANKKWNEDPERYFNHYKEHNIPCISITSCLKICEEYIKLVLKQ